MNWNIFELQFFSVMTILGVFLIIALLMDDSIANGESEREVEEPSRALNQIANTMEYNSKNWRNKNMTQELARSRRSTDRHNRPIWKSQVPTGFRKGKGNVWYPAGEDPHSNKNARNRLSQRFAEQKKQQELDKKTENEKIEEGSSSSNTTIDYKDKENQLFHEVSRTKRADNQENLLKRKSKIPRGMRKTGNRSSWYIYRPPEGPHSNSKARENLREVWQRKQNEEEKKNRSQNGEGEQVSSSSNQTHDDNNNDKENQE